MRSVVLGGWAVAAVTLVACGGSAPLGIGDAGLPDAAWPDAAPPDSALPDLIAPGMGVEPLAACGAFSACGGDATGSWKSVRTCSDVGNGAGGIQVCPQARFDLSKIKLETTLDLRADGSYTSSTLTGGTPGVILPQTCLQALMFMGQPLQCVQLGAVLTLLLSQNQMGQASQISKIDCNEMTTDCSCVVVFKAAPAPVVETGTWRAQNNLLYTKPAGGMETQAEYCVQASQLTMKATIATGLGGLMGGAAGPQVVVVLQH